MNRFYGYASALNTVIPTTGYISGPAANATYPGVLCNVHEANTSTLAVIFNAGNVALTNPFFVSTDGTFQFYGSASSYDVTFTESASASAGTSMQVLLPSYVTAGLPSATVAGQLAHVTDGLGGIWLSTGTEWIPLADGRVIVYGPTDSVVSSVSIGVDALQSVTSAINNIAIGDLTLQLATSGGSNQAIGYSALARNTSGNGNVAIGDYSLEHNTTGFDNVGVGNSTLDNNTTGYESLAMGRGALNDATTGSSNVAIGVRSQREQNTGNNNTSVGVEALYMNIAGNQTPTSGFPSAPYWTGGSGWSLDTSAHIAHKNSNGTGVLTYAAIDFGVGATYRVIYTVSNLSVGAVTASFAGQSDTERTANGTYTWFVTASAYPSDLVFTPTGASANTSRFDLSDISFYGTSAKTANSNTAIGVGAGYQTTTGGSNTYLGVGSGRQHTTGVSNTFLGVQAGTQNGTGDTNTGVGANALYTGNASSGNVALGYGAGFYETGSNSLFIDNATRASEADGRLKSLIYGGFASTAAAQFLTVNGLFNAIALRGAATAFASLPSSPVEGMLATVTNSNTATWGATISGGGSNRVLAYYNGSNWTVAAV